MHIPPYYKKRTWQSFFLGVLAGVIIGYLFFLFVYGKHTERWIEENMEIRTELKQVKQENDLLKQDKENLNEEHEEKLTIQSFEINLSNAKDLELDRFTEYELIEKIEDELNPVIGRNIASVSEQRDLLIRTIENQTYHVRDINYSVKISHLTVAPILVVTVEVTVETGGATL
ncbi:MULTISPECIES: sporulation membrane protein YtrI [Allobacillus]|uniref:Sporulation membrane protein YtrI C-terminal domain-containing protein n=1 Tax=Allobacillus salarius TaxID=1955272 RepID=A0A556PQ33_9BACI|nr:sporulation membrane protein YtrI [Allobacillus salarius]TSJ66475.1 hypothetical protein FPQ13_04250 [Allobacillus salarius]